MARISTNLVPALPRSRRIRRLSLEDRIYALKAAVVEAARWLDVKAPGRAHNTLTEALRRDKEESP